METNIKKVYKLNHSDKIIECEVIKNTDKTIVYLEGSCWQRTVRKVDLNQPNNFLTTIVATSKASLIDAIKKTVNNEIKRLEDSIEYQKEKLNNILKKL